jgi:hypothetical protein
MEASRQVRHRSADANLEANSYASGRSADINSDAKSYASLHDVYVEEEPPHWDDLPRYPQSFTQKTYEDAVKSARWIFDTMVQDGPHTCKVSHVQHKPDPHFNFSAMKSQSYQTKM